MLIATYGDDGWNEIAWARAYPSIFDSPGASRVVVHHEPDGTLASTRNNAAARLMSGDVGWLCFLDADDELEPGYLEAMDRAAHDHAFNHTVDYVQTASGPRPTRNARLAPSALLAPAVRYVLPSGSAGDAAIPNAGKWPATNECVIGTLIREDLFRALGGFRELPSLEDYDLWLRAVKAGAQIVHVPDAVYRAHVRPGSRNSDQTVYQQLVAEHASVFGR